MGVHTKMTVHLDTHAFSADFHSYCACVCLFPCSGQMSIMQSEQEMFHSVNGEMNNTVCSFVSNRYCLPEALSNTLQHFTQPLLSFQTCGFSFVICCEKLSQLVK